MVKIISIKAIQESIRANSNSKGAVYNEQKRGDSENTAIESNTPVTVKDSAEFLQKYYNNVYYSQTSKQWEAYRLQDYSYKGNNIPLSLHIVWITQNHAPLELDEEGRSNLEHNINILNADGSKWNFNIWTKDQNLIPGTIKFCENLPQCQIREISELSQYEMFKDTVTRSINLKLFSLGSDIIRANVLKEFGGVYVDTDYVFSNSPAKLHDYLDFYGGFEKESWAKQIGTGFIAAKPYHPVTLNYVKIAHSLYFIEPDEDVPYFLPNVADCHAVAVMAGGPFALTAAYHLQHNKYGNRDIVFSHNMIHEKDNDSQKLLLDGNLFEVPKIGTQYYQGSWNGVCKNTYLNVRESFLPTPKDPYACDLQQNKFGITQSINKVLASASQVTCREDDPIEFISHRVWITQDTPLTKRALTISLNSIKKLDTDTHSWTHYWWMLKREHYSDEMIEMFSANNIVLKTIDELYQFDSRLKLAIEQSLEVSPVLSADTVRWTIINNYGGLYMDIDYQVVSTKVISDLHYCSEFYISKSEDKWLLNGLIGAKKGNLMAKTSSDEYIRLLVEEPDSFISCSKKDQIFGLNIYGHIKPFINLVLSEKIDASSIILIPEELAVSYAEGCSHSQYGPIVLSSLGFDYRFNTWDSGSSEINTNKLDSFVLEPVGLLTDICDQYESLTM